MQLAIADDSTDWVAGFNSKVALPGYSNRPYDVFVPEGHETPMPVVIVLHGGGSDAVNANRVTCPGGDGDHRDCITGHAARNAYIAVFPRGTPRLLLRRVRTWNAGGGDPDKRWICTSGLACSRGVDDIRYFNVLLDALARSGRVDITRVYVTGISNGAAMAHRLACELPHRIAAIAAVAGANQASAVQGCIPGRPVPVMQIHGTADCAWPYEGGTPFCQGAPRFEGAYLAVERSMRVWQEINGCSAKYVVTALADRFDDDTQVARLDWPQCKAPLVAYRIEGGGHTWPNGFQYLATSRIGPVSKELTNEDIWAFLASHSLP